MKPSPRVVAAALAALVFVPAAFAAREARAQIGTGGVSGSTTLASSDLYLSVQKTKGTNLTQRDQARFLNHTHCVCNDTVWLQARVLQVGTSIAKAQAIDPTATVSAYVGSSCDQPTLRPACKSLGSMPMSQFRVSGFTAETTVGELAKYRPIGDTTGSGGISGTGGASATGGVSGTGGTGTGGMGTGGAGTGGDNGSGGAPAVSKNPYCEKQFTQSFWLFIGTGEGDTTLGSGTQPLLMDVQAPPAPVLAVPQPGHQALSLSWPAIASTDAADIQGYQILCTRGESTSVFKDTDFTPAFDSCENESGTDPDGNPVPWPRPDTRFVCSGLLSPSSSSYRLKILENEVQYKVAVAAIDKQGNASVVSPRYGTPTLTEDFYYKYRHGDRPGSAEGGFCSIAEGTPSHLAVLGGLGLVTALGLLARARRGGRSRRQP